MSGSARRKRARCRPRRLVTSNRRQVITNGSAGVSSARIQRLGEPTSRARVPAYERAHTARSCIASPNDRPLRACQTTTRGVVHVSSPAAVIASWTAVS